MTEDDNQPKPMSLSLLLVIAVVTAIVTIPLDIFFVYKILALRYSPDPSLEHYDGLGAAVYFIFLLITLIPTVVSILALFAYRAQKNREE